jgi:hypothetical protein
MADANFKRAARRLKSALKSKYETALPTPTAGAVGSGKMFIGGQLFDGSIGGVTQVVNTGRPAAAQYAAKFGGGATIVRSVGGGGGSSGSVDSTTVDALRAAPYLVVAPDDVLTNERQLSLSSAFVGTPGPGIYTLGLTTPGSVSATSTNLATGNHTHAVTASDAPGAAVSLLKSSAAGNLTLPTFTASTKINIPYGSAATPSLTFPNNSTGLYGVDGALIVAHGGSAIGVVSAAGLTAAGYGIQNVTDPQSGGMSLGSSGVLNWQATYPTKDVGLSRGAAGTLYVGNGTAGNASGTLLASNLYASTLVRTPLITTAGLGVDLTIGSADDILLDPTSNMVKLLPSKVFQSDNYASQLTGMRITHDGQGDFRYIYTDELHAKAFIADLEQALAGGQIIAKSVTLLYLDFTAPAAGATTAMTVRDLPSATGMAVFQDGDYIRARTFNRSGGGLDISDCWGTIVLDTSYGVSGFDSATKSQRYTFTRSTAPNAGAMSAGTVVFAESIVLDYGTSGNGFYEVNAIDGLHAANSPYAQIVTWTTHPRNATLRARLGNLYGVFALSGEYGLYAGNGTADGDEYLRISNSAVRLNNIPLRIYSGGVQTVDISNTDGSVKLGTNIASPSTTSFDFNGTTGALSIAGSLSAAGGLFTANDYGANIQAFESSATWSTFGRALTFTTDPDVPDENNVVAQIYGQQRDDVSPSRNHLRIQAQSGTDSGIDDAYVEIHANNPDLALGILAAGITLQASATLGNAVHITAQEEVGPGYIYFLGTQRTQHVEPYTSTDTYDIGTASIRYRTIYARDIIVDTISGATLSGAEWEYAGSMVIDANSASTTTVSIVNQGAGVANLTVDGTITSGGTAVVLASRTVTAGTGLTGGGALSGNITISHDDTSSQASVDNSGSTFIQDITLDGFGHVTGLVSADVSTALAGYLKDDGSVTGATSQTQIFTNGTKQAKIIVSTDNATAFAVRNAADSRSLLNLDATNNVLALRDGAGIFIEVRGSSALSNLGVGTQALATGPSGNFNLAVGEYSLYVTSTGYNNTGAGQYTLYSNTTGYLNVAVGANAMLLNTTGAGNLAVGASALFANSTGDFNVALGTEALRNNTASLNAAVGSNSLYSNTIGTQNMALGSSAMYLNQSGDNNFAAGSAALYSNVSGDNNTAVGGGALYSATGSGNVAVGYLAGYSETGSNKLYIANSSTSSPLIYGDFATSLLRINGDLEVTDNILAANGSASLPAIAASADTNTGILWSAADTLGLSTGGAQRVTLSTTSLESTVRISVAADTDTNNILGRGVVGYALSTDTATFSHYDHATATNYALAHTSAGAAWLNSASGQITSLAINGAAVLTVSGSSVESTVRLSAAANADANNVLGRSIIGNALGSDTATFAHYDHNTSGNYAVGQTNAAATWLNSASGQVTSLAIGGTALVTVNSAGIQSPTYVSQLTGWRIESPGGNADFRYLYASELHAKTFIADLEQALAGGQIITPSVTVLHSAFTAPAAGASTTLTVKDLPSATGMQVFVNGHIVDVRTFSRSAGSLTVGDCWGTVVLDTSYGTSGFDSATKTQRYTFTRSAAPNAGAMTAGTVVQPDTIVLDYGVSGNGFVETTTVDGAYGANSPYTQIVTWTTHPATGKAIRTRLGNLSGLPWGVANEFGLYAGNGTADSDAFIRLSSYTNRFNNVPIEMWSGGNRIINITPADGIDIRISASSGDDNSALSFRNASDTVGYLKAYELSSSVTFELRTMALTGLASSIQIQSISPDNQNGSMSLQTVNASGSAENSINLSRAASAPSSAAMTFASSGKIRFTTQTFFESDLNIGLASGTTWLIQNSATNLVASYGGQTKLTLTTAGDLTLAGDLSLVDLTLSGGMGSDLDLNGNDIIDIGTIGTAWSNLSFETGWGNYGGSFVTGQYKKVGDLVFLRGFVKRSSGSSANIATLPGTHVPLKTEVFAITSNNASGVLTLNTSGILTLDIGSPTVWVSLSGLVFSVL